MPTLLRPMSTGEILDRTFYLYRKYFLLFVGICAVPQLFQSSFQILARLTGWGAPPRMDSLAAFGRMVVFQLTSLAVALLVIAISQAATTLAVSSVHLDQATSITETYKKVAGKIARVAVMVVLVGIAIMCGLVLLIVPGILLGLAWSLCVPAAVIENRSIGDAIARSRKLTYGHRGQIFVVYLLFMIFNVIFALLWEAPLFAIAGFGAIARHEALPVWFSIAVWIGSFVTNSLLGPLLTIAIALIYYDTRVRKEAFDLQYMMAAAGAPQDPSRP